MSFSAFLRAPSLPGWPGLPEISGLKGEMLGFGGQILGREGKRRMERIPTGRDGAPGPRRAGARGGAPGTSQAMQPSAPVRAAGRKNRTKRMRRPVSRGAVENAGAIEWHSMTMGGCPGWRNTRDVQFFLFCSPHLNPDNLSVPGCADFSLQDLKKAREQDGRRDGEGGDNRSTNPAAWPGRTSL
jgi:hypothetical protein